MRKYWVHFRILNKDKMPMGQGEMAVTRTLPITDERDLMEIGQAITKSINEQDSMKEPFFIQVYDWIKFEEPSIALATNENLKKLLRN